MKVTNQTQALAHEILAYWLRFNKHDQSKWVGDYAKVLTKKVGEADVNVCSTTMCAAGTAVFLTHAPQAFVEASRDWNFDIWMLEGGEALGLNRAEANLVFLADEKSAKRYMRAIAAGSQKKFDKATEKRVATD